MADMVGAEVCLLYTYTNLQPDQLQFDLIYILIVHVLFRLKIKTVLKISA